MVRGPNHTGRGPAHLTVLPGGASRPVDDDERTSIDPGPPQEHEESYTPIVGGGQAGTSEEHWEDGTTVAESGKKLLEDATIDEQARVLPPLQLVQALPARASARLAVDSGPDQGRIHELATVGRPTLIGRAVDNDLVLTDLSVSRRHLELAWEGDAWVLRDCGSGNGTLINERLEDGRCQLRHGDRIEIGNTVFRFDHPASAGAGLEAPGWGQGDDDDELATVNGRPGRATGETATPEAHARPSPAIAQRRTAPATVPPARGAGERRLDATVPPERGVRTTHGSPSVPPPRPPPPPRFLTGERGAVLPSAEVSFVSERAGSLPPYLASGPPAGAAGSMVDSIGGGIVLPPVRSSGSLAPPYATMRGPDRRRLYIGLGSGALVAALVIGAIAGGSTPGEPAPRAEVMGGPALTSGAVAGTATASAATVTPTVVQPALATATQAGTATGTATGTGSATVPGSGSGSAAGPGTAAATVPDPGPGAVPGTTPPTPALAPPPTTDTADDDAPAVTPPPEAPPAARTTPPRTAPPRTRPTPPRTAPARTAVARRAPVALDEPARPARTPGGEKAVALAEKKADTLYRTRKFSDAAATLRAAISETEDPSTARRLKNDAAAYEALGANVTAGNSPDATVAYIALSRALTADRKIGEAHQSFLRGRLAPVAPKAAATFLARGKFEEAKRAADTAVNVGAGGTPTIAQVRSTLETKAGGLYNAAAKQMAKKPEDAKAQLRRVLAMVPSDSPWYAKARALLAKGTRKD